MQNTHAHFLTYMYPCVCMQQMKLLLIKKLSQPLPSPWSIADQLWTGALTAVADGGGFHAQP